MIKPGDTTTVASAHTVLEGKSRKGFFARLLPFLGPAFVACVAYIDPGNFATNIQGGAEFGYMLLWVILASNLMAMVIQALSAKLGIATGRNLAADLLCLTTRGESGLSALGTEAVAPKILTRFEGAFLLVHADD